MKKIERVRLHSPIKRVRFSDFAPPRKQRRPRGPNKQRLITDDRRLLTRRDIAAICGVSVDTVKKWQAAGIGLEPVRLSPNGRTVFYDIDQAAHVLKIALRRRRAQDPAPDAPAVMPPPSEQAPRTLQ